MMIVLRFVAALIWGAFVCSISTLAMYGQFPSGNGPMFIVGALVFGAMYTPLQETAKHDGRYDLKRAYTNLSGYLLGIPTAYFVGWLIFV